ncbi:dephospho-CoA kinase [Marinobacterium arenosum]|uniref:dephospho-CoA kinase n=1 Tax=Marinobacterium arenosum TaxID=2862496 RepID=UPI001C946A0B|nr:dephospho-CoA kinase [Marinobacterium arenosum]MBY4676587.1 dephospho-CoA kinase [Marinobacterium arenosum]
MYVVGLTGGIGSGKTAVSNRLQAKGIRVIDADMVARQVVEPGQPALARIQQHFGDEVLTDSGELNRSKLRSIVFASEKQRTWLEQLLHPLIRDRILQQLEESQSSYTLLVSPLLLETDQHLLVNHIVVVDADESQQLSRTRLRDNSSEEQIRAILAAQMSREERRSKADTILDNSGDLVQLEAQVDKLHQQLLQAASRESESE